MKMEDILTLKSKINKIVTFLQPYLEFTNCHMVEYFTNNLWEKYIPVSIRNEIEKIGYEKALDDFWNDGNKDFYHLSDFIKKCSQNTIDYLEIASDKENFVRDIPKWKTKEFMSEKKTHEVLTMSKLISNLTNKLNTNYLLDLGDGKGYLSSFLSTYFQLNVLGVDSEPLNTKNAQKRAEKFFKIYKHKMVNYKQITERVTKDTDLKYLLSKEFPNVDKYGMIGLHTCGNLASDCLKLYSSNEDCQFICNVGCCYNHLVESFENNTTFGFPLSDYLKDVKLGRNTRMLAAQSIDRIFNDKELPSNSLFFRAVFEVLLQNSNLKDRIQVGKKGAKCVNFFNYTKTISKEFDLKLSENEVLNVYESYRTLQNQLNIFYLIRAQLAPVIESLILADRLLYLIEKKFLNSHLIKLFDPVISPRCYVIVSIKSLV